jgi:Fe-S cluster biosynthesis and repair protein YggX
MKERKSDWKIYIGSSKWLMQDIKKIGKEHFKFEVIAEYKNRRSLRYYELYYQMKFNVLSSTFEGTDEPAYYNSRVGGKFYRPVESYQDPKWRKKQTAQLNRDRNTKRDPVTGRFIKHNVHTT